MCDLCSNKPNMLFYYLDAIFVLFDFVVECAMKHFVFDVFDSYIKMMFHIFSMLIHSLFHLLKTCIYFFKSFIDVFKAGINISESELQRPHEVLKILFGCRRLHVVCHDHEV